MTSSAHSTDKPLTLDNPNLIRELCNGLKASHSSLGRSLDFSMKKSRSDEHSSISMNRKERERQLKAQAEQQKAWDIDGGLQIPTLPTMAPSFTKAADEGVEALGGTKLGRPGYVSVIGLVPTQHTIKCIDDDYELISSFRPYQHDARRAAREAAMREKAAPHPDLLQQLKPSLNWVSPSALVDVGALPLSMFESNKVKDTEMCENSGEDESEQTITCDHPKHIPPIGTYPFTNLGRGGERRRLPGQRMPQLGQYHPRFKVVEPRVTGGHIQPMTQTRSRTAVDESAKESEGGSGATGAAQEGAAATEGEQVEATSAKPQVGSWMFASGTERDGERKSAAPDVFYWPYPDVRSTTKRVICPVRFDIASSHRRRDLQVSGVPAGVYNVTKDLGEGVRDLTMMKTRTGRDSDWISKRDRRVAAASDNLDVDAALAATRPHVKETQLPPRESATQEAERRQQVGKVDTTVSIERDLSFPAPQIAFPEQQKRIRAFEKMVSRDGLPQRDPPGLQLDYTTDPNTVKRRCRSAIIHRRAPGHGDLHDPNPNELGEIPNMKWVKPNHNRTTEFGAGSSRPDHLLPLKDLSYHVEPGYKVVEPRVKGDPMIGTTTNRNQREKITSTKSCGAEVMYDNIDLKDKAKSVPLFEKQITKETQFCGHRIPSERWERNNPKAPGPGYYDVKYSAVEV